MASKGNSWNGAKVIASVRAASIGGINETLSECVGESKAVHDGWQNRTGTAEGSIRITAFAAAEGARIVGRWGSEGVEYMLALEYLHGAALRTAADVQYPTLIDRIRRRLR